MATIAELLVKIGGDSSGLRKELNAAQRQIKRAFGQEALSFSKKAAGVLGAFTAALGAVGVAGVVTAGKLKMTERAFETLTGSAEGAKQMLSDLRKLDDQSSLDFKSLSKGAQRLLAFKFAAQDVVPILNVVGDASAALGKGAEGVERISLALAQIQAKGRAQGEELLQLAEAGINAYDYLADYLGVSVPQLMKQIQKGAVDSTTAINAILLGMQNDYRGMMGKMANETPVVWDTIKSNLVQILASFGSELEKALGINKILQNIRDQLVDFKAAVEQVGINEVLKNLVPPYLTASIFALAGALTGAAIPAMVKFGMSVWSAMAPLLPFMALGAGIGLLAWAIWKAWEPLSTLFSGLWQNIVGSCKWAWSLIETIIYGALAGVFNAIDWVFKKIGVQNPLAGFTEQLNVHLNRATTNMKSAQVDMNEGVQKMIDGGKEFGKAMVNEFKKIGDSANDLKKEFAGLTTGGNTGPSQAEIDAFEKLKKKAEQLSESIEREWVQMTKTEEEQLDIWYQEQLDALEKSKAANENYERDLQRLKETYAAKAQKLAEDKAEKEERKLERLRDKAKSISESIEREWVQTTKTELEQLEIWKAEQIKALEETKDYNENYQRDLERVEAVYSQRRLKILEDEYEKRKNMWNDMLQKARDAGDISAYMNLLNSERALFEQDLAGRQAMIDQYYQYWEETHRSTMDRMAEVMGGLYSGLENFFVDVINNAKSIGDAWQSLKNSILAMLGQMVAKWMASQIMMKIFGQTMQSTLAAASVATAGSISAAWAPAAAMVSLATMGANAGPAMSGITATTALSEGLARIPALAEGGITTGPTIAEIGEGRYREAVIPLNRRYFEKVGLVDKKEPQSNFVFSPTIQAMDSKSFKRWLDDGGGNVMINWMRKAYREFEPVEV